MKDSGEVVGGFMLIIALCGAGFFGGWHWRGDHAEQLEAARAEGRKRADFLNQRELNRLRKDAVNAGHAEFYVSNHHLLNDNPTVEFRWLDKELADAGFVKAEPATNSCITCHAKGSFHWPKPRRTFRSLVPQEAIEPLPPPPEPSE